MITISAFRWVPDFAQGQVRDLRARWALEEAGLPYRTRLLDQGDQECPPEEGGATRSVRADGGGAAGAGGLAAGHRPKATTMLVPGSPWP
jgi:hypothetical protein